MITGSIASGKSTLSRAVAAQLEDDGRPCAVIDLDLLYEMVDVRRRPKDDERIWAQARRMAGRLARAFLVEGRSVVVEGGDLATLDALGELERELPQEAVVRLVLLEVDLETALQRARSDDTRGISRDRAFLSAHYDEFSTSLPGRDILRLDTGRVSVGEGARSVVEWAR